jgi:hyaluronan synthase
MDRFLTERFLGVFLEVSDDRTLTNLTLKEGFRTAYQYTSLVYTDAPLRLGKLYRQQLRWARGSQYNTLRMLPWMIGHTPLLALFFSLDILLPFLLAGVLAGWIYRSATGQGYDFYVGMLNEYGLASGVAVVFALMVVSSVVSMAIRQMRHLAEKPTDFFRLPIFIVISTVFLMPVRLIGFFRMAHVSGWGTRAGAYGEEWADQADVLADQSGRGGVPGNGGGGATVIEARPVARKLRFARLSRPRRHVNPQAGVPYLIGILIFALEVYFIATL